MSLYNLPNTTSGFDGILVSIVTEVPSLTVMFTAFVFVFVFITGMGLQQKRSGFADVPLWATLGFLSATFLNLIFSLGSGITNPITLGVVIALTMFSALWLFLSKGRFEN